MFLSKRKPLKRSLFKKHKEAVNVEEITRMYNFFLSIWKKRPHRSEVSKTPLYETDGLPSSAYFHHILPKETYPQAKYDEENIILLTIDEHANVHSDCFCYPEINIRRECLLKKYYS
jgi:hypothetical protein